MNAEELKKKWEAAGIHAVRNAELKVEAGYFYICWYYFADINVDFEMKPIITVTSYESVYDALAFIRYSAMPGFLAGHPEFESRQNESGRLYAAIDSCIAAGPDAQPEKVEELLVMYNRLFEFRHPEMPHIGRWGRLKYVIRTDVLSDILSNKRVRLKNSVLKALIDVNKFDDENGEHLILVRRFFDQIMR